MSLFCTCSNGICDPKVCEIQVQTATRQQRSDVYHRDVENKFLNEEIIYF